MTDLRKRFPVYSRLLLLYPAPYRTRYDEQILQTLADMLDANSSHSARLQVWVRTIRDFPRSLITQRAQYASSVLAHETPGFVRKNVAMGGWLFAPFFLIAITNDMESHRLYHSWFWRPEVLFAWLRLFPTAGLILIMATFCVWLRMNKAPLRLSLKDVGHNWVMLFPMIIGMSVVFAVFARS